MLNLFFCLQGGPERSRPGKMHLQNTIMPCASPALFTHKTPCIYAGLPAALWRGKQSSWRGLSFLVDHNLQPGLHFISLQLDSNVNVHIKIIIIKKHSKTLKLCHVFPCKLVLELILTEGEETDEAVLARVDSAELSLQQLLPVGIRSRPFLKNSLL